MKRNLFTLILPGLLVAATGVGAGDLATASFTGSELGVAVLWAVVVGGVFKCVLTEGIARWQLVNGNSLLEGLVQKLGKVFVWIFLAYLVLWSFFVGSALMSASGAALHALFPVFEPSTGKIVFGLASSMCGLALARLGKFTLFAKTMGVCVGLMFAVVLFTAYSLWPGHAQVLSGLFVPSIPDFSGKGLTWTVALIGGVGGTLTIFCYGYWIQEQNRTSANDILLCKIDLAVGYGMTILFGLAMVIIGSTIVVEGKGAGLLIKLAASLETAIGPVGKWLFLVGAFSAIFSSLLGVWQAVPYMFADISRHIVQPKFNTGVVRLNQTQSYKIYQILLAVVPILGLLLSFKEIQKLYSVVGTLFMPFLAVALLYLNNQGKMGKHKNSVLINGVLLATLVFFSYVAWQKFVA